MLVRARVWAVLGMVAAAGCSESAAPPAPPVSVVVTPATATVEVGATVQLSAAVRNVTDGTVIWQSATPAVATVSAAGLVSGKAAGVAAITATHASGAADAATVTVTAPPAPVVGITIANLRDPATGNTLNPNALAGRVEAVLNVEGEAARAVVLIDTREACSATSPFTGTGALKTATCVFDTGSYDAQTGAIRFANGVHTVSARLLDASGKVLATASRATAFANRDTLVVTASAPTTASDSAGRSWSAGTLTVHALPVIFGPERPSRIAFTLRSRVDTTNTSVTSTDTDSAGGWVAVFPADKAPAQGGTLGLADSATVVTAAATYPSGNAAPSATAALRYDQAAPTIRANAFTLVAGFSDVQLQASFVFTPATTGLANSLSDRGAGAVSCTFHAGLSGNDPAGFAQITRAGDLGTSTDPVYTAEVRCRDALGNLASQLLGNGSGGAQRFSVY